MLRKRVRYLVPGCLGTHKNVLAWLRPKIAIYGSHHHLANRAAMHANQWGTALLTEASGPSRRGFVALDELLARRPPEVSGSDDASRCIRSPMRLPADRAVAVADELERSSDFVRNSSTKAASLYGHVETSISTVVRPNVPHHPRAPLLRASGGGGG